VRNTPTDEQVTALQKELNDVCIRHKLTVWAVGVDGGSAQGWCSIGVVGGKDWSEPGFHLELEGF
jgi:hypothetical protein